MFLCQLFYVNLQDILVDHSDIVIFCQGLFQNRDQVVVDFYRNHFSGCLSQILGHGSNTRADLQHHILFCHACCPNDLVQYMGIDQEVLSKLLLESKLVFLDHLDGILRVAKFFSHSIILLFRLFTCISSYLITQFFRLQ